MLCNIQPSQLIWLPRCAGLLHHISRAMASTTTLSDQLQA